MDTSAGQQGAVSRGGPAAPGMVPWFGSLGVFSWLLLSARHDGSSLHTERHRQLWDVCCIHKETGLRVVSFWQRHRVLPAPLACRC